MTAEAIQSSSARVARIVEGVPDDALGLSTPAGDMSVGDLLDHVSTFCGVFTGSARKDFEAAASPGRPPSADRLADGWRSAIPSRLATLAAAWSEPTAWTGMTRAGPLPSSGELAGAIALDELVVHGWDLARAAGLPYEVADETLELVRAFIDGQVGPGKPIPREAVFAAAVDVPPGAPLLDRVIALSGRDPSWRPAP